MSEMERRFKQRESEQRSGSPLGADLTDDDDDSRVLIAPTSRSSGVSARGGRCKVLCLLATVVLGAVLVSHALRNEWSSVAMLYAVTWNIAAINNNPFEYWITHNDKDYNALMEAVQHFIDDPKSRDVPVSQIFSQSMWMELKELMIERGWDGIEQTDKLWRTDFSSRKIISEFMQDKTLGDKRLASMPDRYTNTINTIDAGVVNRPTVINCFDGDMTSVQKWWSQWKFFMFKKSLHLTSGSKGPLVVEPVGMLSKIKKSKYPAITADEEAISIPLQTLALAIFDAVLIHIVNSVSPSGKWQVLQQQMCEALNRRKDEHTINILTSYSEATVIFLQETASSFISKAAKSVLGERYQIIVSESLDGKRDQNSLILLSKAFFRASSVKELTGTVLGSFTHSVPVSNGDLLVISAEDVLGRQYLLASFHGDTNGLATLPVLAAVHKLATSMPTHRLIFGQDANTYETGSISQQGVTEFAADFVSKGYSSCWGDFPNPKAHTTFNARTFLQAQLQKAARVDEMITRGDKNPKDFILFSKSGFSLISASKDNTGKRKYVDDMVFPTLDFPSDHGLVMSKLRLLG